MKRSKFTEAQIALYGEEGTAVDEICRKARINESTYYYWRNKYGDLLPSEVKRLRPLEEENGKLKKIVADLSPSSAESFEACPVAATGGSCSYDLASEHSMSAYGNQ
jgi:putative transposase